MKFSVSIIESERGWGQKVDEVKIFESADKAWEFANEFNSHNTAKEAPDWYMRANDPVPVR